MFCGAALGAELLPLIVILESHVLAAVSLVYNLSEGSDSLELGTSGSGILSDKSKQFLLQLVSEGKLLILESTGFAEAATDEAPEWKRRVN